jgi:exopolysaccharide biosynthesis polyprenyl glycosylphosphotransferase
LWLGDLIAASLAMGGAILSWFGYSWLQLTLRGVRPMTALKFIPNNVDVPIWFYFLPVIWVALLVDLYDSHAAASRRRTRRGIAIAAFIGLVLYALVFLTFRDPQDLPRIGVGAFLLLASALTLGWRALYIRLYTATGFQRRVLVIGAGKAGRTLARLYKTAHPPPFQFIGFIDDDHAKIGRKPEGFPVFGSSEHLLAAIDAEQVTDLVIAVMGEMRGATFQTILDAQERGLEIIPMPTLYEEMTGRVPIHHLESDWIVRSFVDQARVSGFYDLSKRVLDVLGGLVGTLIFAIFLPFIALATVIDTGLPIFYSQARLGKGATLFTIKKFRTMHQNAEADGKARLAAENDPRVTRVGNFLRKLRLDELPQFWNVLRGEMSLVGPRAERPELVAEFQKQIPFYRARLLVKPGLSGWAQINYGYVASVTETAVKLEYDLYYIKHRTFMMDIQIILRTIGTVFRAGGR